MSAQKRQEWQKLYDEVLARSPGTDTLPPEARHDRLCQLNVLEQVANVCQTYVVQDAWQRGQPLTIHGWIYGLKDGLMRDLDITVNAADQLPGRYATALSTLL